MQAKLFSSALAFELGALALLLLESASLALLCTYFALHAIASGLLALLARMLVPQRYREPRLLVLTCFFAANFFMPLAGLLCFVVGLAVAKLWPRNEGSQDFDTTHLPRFTTHRNHEGTGFRGGQVRAQLGNAAAPLPQRLKALVAVQDAPARVTGTLLRDLLADPADDIRLLAYGILDNKEKQITQRIVEHRQRLERSTSPAESADLHKRLAELYWELIYQNLVQGDMQAFAVDQVRHHGYQALRQNDSDAGLWFRLARMELNAGRLDAAEHALQQAQLNGFARERLLPYWAEQRFLQKRYAEVRVLFEELAGQAGVPALGQARRYWVPGGSPTFIQKTLAA